MKDTKELISKVLEAGVGIEKAQISAISLIDQLTPAQRNYKPEGTEFGGKTILEYLKDALQRLKTRISEGNIDGLTQDELSMRDKILDNDIKNLTHEEEQQLQLLIKPNLTEMQQELFDHLRTGDFYLNHEQNDIVQDIIVGDDKIINYSPEFLDSLMQSILTLTPEQIALRNRILAQDEGINADEIKDVMKPDLPLRAILGLMQENLQPTAADLNYSIPPELGFPPGDTLAKWIEGAKLYIADYDQPIGLWRLAADNFKLLGMIEADSLDLRWLNKDEEYYEGEGDDDLDPRKELLNANNYALTKQISLRSLLPIEKGIFLKIRLFDEKISFTRDEINKIDKNNSTETLANITPERLAEKARNYIDSLYSEEGDDEETFTPIFAYFLLSARLRDINNMEDAKYETLRLRHEEVLNKVVKLMCNPSYLAREIIRIVEVYTKLPNEVQNELILNIYGGDSVSLVDEPYLALTIVDIITEIRKVAADSNKAKSDVSTQEMLRTHGLVLPYNVIQKINTIIHKRNESSVSENEEIEDLANACTKHRWFAHDDSLNRLLKRYKEEFIDAGLVFAQLACYIRLLTGLIEKETNLATTAGEFINNYRRALLELLQDQFAADHTPDPGLITALNILSPDMNLQKLLFAEGVHLTQQNLELLETIARHSDVNNKSTHGNKRLKR